MRLLLRPGSTQLPAPTSAGGRGAACPLSMTRGPYYIWLVEVLVLELTSHDYIHLVMGVRDSKGEAGGS
jgi:hypothetical protein